MGNAQIVAVPLGTADRKEFIDTANEVFEAVLRRLDPMIRGAVRKLWDAENYVDNGPLDESMLPISRDYALSLIDAFLVHHVIGLASRADALLAGQPIKGASSPHVRS